LILTLSLAKNTFTVPEPRADILAVAAPAMAREEQLGLDPVAHGPVAASAGDGHSCPSSFFVMAGRVQCDGGVERGSVIRLVQ